jgi:hypothetical protein
MSHTCLPNGPFAPRRIRTYIRPMKITWGVALIATIIGLVAASFAEAKSPPKGKYQCTISSSIIYGDLFITGKSTYKFGLDGKYKKGTYKAKGKLTSGNYKGQPKISFKTGRLKKHNGRWFKATSGRYEIALKNPKSGFESIYCDK